MAASKTKAKQRSAPPPRKAPKTKGPPAAEVLTQPIGELKDHPRNYRKHPPDQIEHLAHSIRTNGFYRNVVVARDNTILAGHGIVAAARHLGLKSVPTMRLQLDPNSSTAMRLLTGDNEVGKLGEIDDRELTNILKELKDTEGLLGTGFDERSLAALLMVTRPAAEIADFNEASHWIGMPEFEMVDAPLKIVMSFRNKKDRAEFAKILKLPITEKTRSLWFPHRTEDDVASVRFKAAK